MHTAIVPLTKHEAYALREIRQQADNAVTRIKYNPAGPQERDLRCLMVRYDLMDTLRQRIRDRLWLTDNVAILLPEREPVAYLAYEE